MSASHYRQVFFGFPGGIIEPGKTEKFRVTVGGVFRANKLILCAIMDVIRGHFRLKRLPKNRQWLNRDNVIAYSTLSRSPKKRRTIIEYREHAIGNFVRSYLPSSVQYKHVDALRYLRLNNIFVDTHPQTGANALPALLFSAEARYNDVRMETAPDGTSIAIVIENQGDIPIQVSGGFLGVAIG